MGFAPFFSLGAASYMDADEKSGDDFYRQKAQKLNPLLRENFPLLYEQLAAQLSAILGIQTEYDRGLGLPGFHIFLSSKVFEQPMASMHFDLQYQSIKWPYSKIDFSNPISYTVSMILPKHGGGLYYWDLFYDQVKDLNHHELEALKKTMEPKYLPYKIGQLILHRGLVLHQIAPSKNVEEEDERITLQGHGLICDEVLRLYW